MNNGMKVFTGFSLGLLAGAVAGLLYAPDKGEKTRKKLKKEYDKTYKDSIKKVDEFKASMNKEIENATSKGKDTIDHLKEAINYKN